MILETYAQLLPTRAYYLVLEVIRGEFDLNQPISQDFVEICDRCWVGVALARHGVEFKRTV